MDNLPFSIRSLLFNINNDVNIKYIGKIIQGECLSTKQIHSLLLWLIRCWCKSLDICFSNNHTCFIGIVSLPTNSIVDIVEELSFEKEFCQIVLLLPEREKVILISNLTNHVNQSSEKHSKLSELFIKYAFLEYANNIMQIFTDLEKDTIALFFKNIQSLIGLLCNISIEHAFLYCFHLLDMILPTHKKKRGTFSVLQCGQFLDKASSCGFSILNKADLMHVKSLQNLCKTLLETSQLLRLESKQKNVFDEMGSEYYNTIQSVLAFVTDKASALGVKHLVIEDWYDAKTINIFVRVIVKLQILKSVKPEMLNIENFLKVFEGQFSNCGMIKCVCRAVSFTTNQFIDMSNALQKTDGEELFGSWQVDEDSVQKLTTALSRINNIYCGRDVIITWLLEQAEVNTYFEDSFIACLSDYLINYGNLHIFERIVHLCNQHAETTRSNCLKQVIRNTLPYLSTTSSLELINLNLDMSFCVKSDNEFSVQVNQTLNKLTDDDNGNEDALRSAAQLVVVAPTNVIMDILHRVLTGNLKHSVFVKIVSGIPHLLTTTYSITDPNHLQYGKISLSILLKDLYVECNESNKSERLQKILTELITAHPAVFSDFVDVFIIPNVNAQAATQFLDPPFAFSLLHNVLENSPTHFNVTKSWEALQLLLQTKVFPLTQQNTCHHSCVTGLIDNISGQFQNLKRSEQDQFLKELTDLMKNNIGWLEKLHFYRLLCSVGYLHHYDIPLALLDFTETHDQQFWLPIDDEENIVDVYKWKCLLSLGLVPDVYTIFLQHLTPVDADEEIPNLIPAVSKILTDCNYFYGDMIIKCLCELVAKEKVAGIASYLSQDLQSLRDFYPMSFALLILVQAFIMLFGDVMGETYCCVDRCIIILHKFVYYAKNIDNAQFRASFNMYFTEQLVHASTTLENAVTSRLTLLAIDVLQVSIESIKSLDVTTKSSILEKHIEIFEITSIAAFPLEQKDGQQENFKQNSAGTRGRPY